jgi:hypothetical protein
MAFPTLVSSATTRSVTQTDLEVLGLAPAVAMGNLYLATSAALANAATNAANAQKQTNQLAEQVTKLGVDVLTSIVKKRIGL